ncbi:MAG: hypothetical protein SOU51_02725 [Collinsella sp.]|nr:hypothetical protein [Collinsella sp.]
MGLETRGSVLFEMGGRGEAMRVECAVTSDGELLVMQESAGTWTECCFGRFAHREELRFDAKSVATLLEHFSIDEVGQLPAMLRVECGNLGAFLRISDLAHRLGASYRVTEGEGTSHIPLMASDGVDDGRRCRTPR